MEVLFLGARHPLQSEDATQAPSGSQLLPGLGARVRPVRGHPAGRLLGLQVLRPLAVPVGVRHQARHGGDEEVDGAGRLWTGESVRTCHVLAMCHVCSSLQMYSARLTCSRRAWP